VPQGSGSEELDVNSDQLRERFLRFFVDRGHRRIDSAPLVPIGDPTLLFTSAGMVQFKPYFTGRAVPPALRMTSVQRCFRTTDIDVVGDGSHHTFFEMLGNFSVGDYFKPDAVRWAWEFVTGELGIAKDRLWNTVYNDDQVAFDLWLEVGQKPERILRYGEAEGNFWSAGPVGPCGPCSEIFFDWGEEYGCGPTCEPAHDCPRFLEIWNLVFMSLYQDESGQRTQLPKANIDTGAGLERITRVLNSAPSTYETDLFTPIIQVLEHTVGATYGADIDTTRMMRTIVDHARAVTFLIADGVLPSNEGRGYVVRRLIRRSVYYGRLLGRTEPFLSNIAGAVIERMARFYPHLEEQRGSIETTLSSEERRFGETLESGITRLDGLIARLEGQGDALPGEEVFRLYSTYGVPKELTAEIAGRHGLHIDEAGFDRELARERDDSRRQGRFRAEMVSQSRLEFAAAGHGGRFIGYETLSAETAVTGIFNNGSMVERASAGERVELVLAETPFYPEGGGQVGDQGEIRSETGAVRVDDTQRDEGLLLHAGTVIAGTVAVGQPIQARVDAERRQNTMRNHTGTHLLHAALREVLGKHVRQMGSLVAPDRLRFDYQQPQAPAPEQRLQVERLVNEKIRADIPVVTRVMQKDAALGEGVMAFFGDKYGDEVRVVEMAGSEHRFSAELCGGTHVDDTGEIGLLLLINDASIGSGVRRVEALTGLHAERYVEQQVALIDRLARSLGTAPAVLEARVESLVADLEAARREYAATQRQSGRQLADELIASAERVGTTAVVARRTEAVSIDAMREIGDLIKQKLHSAVVVLGAVIGGKPQCVVMLTPDLLPRLNARELLTKGLSTAGVRGGGRADYAQGGGNNAAGLDQAIDEARRLVKESLPD